MRVASVTTNLTCNQICGFCASRAATDDSALFSAEAVSTRISEALDRGAQTIVLTGGEPTLHVQLPSFIRAVESAGQTALLLSNGLALADPVRLEKLMQAGLRTVRITMFGCDERADAVTERPGSFRLWTLGVRAAISAGLEVSLAVPIHGENVEKVEAWPAWIAQNFPAVRQVQVQVVSEPAHGRRPDFGRLLDTVLRFSDACRQADIHAFADSGDALMPCLVRPLRRYAPLLRPLSLTHRNATERVEACASCVVASRCAGLPVEPLLKALKGRIVGISAADERFVIGLETSRTDVAEQQLLSSGFYRASDGKVGVERVVRVNFACNQDCAFCFVDRTLPAVESSRIYKEIRAAAQEGVDLLSLSGGEPTLDRALPDYVRLAAELGMRVQLQTNAVLLDAPNRAAALARAGLTEAFVSLHGADATTSDAMTRRPGTFERTVRGVRALLDAGVEVRLNCVVTGANAKKLRPLAALLDQTFERRAELVLSWASASTDLVPLDAEVVVRVTDVLAEVEALIEDCEQRGVRWRGFEGECGVPLCCLPQEWLDASKIPTRTKPSTNSAPATMSTVAPPPGFLKPDVCVGCAWSDRCPGVRATYAQIHGVSELRTIVELPGSSGGSVK